MNFLGLGPGELMLIAVLGLIVFGPGRLPEVAGQIGRTVRDFRKSTTEISSEFQRSFSLEEPAPAPSAVGPANVFASAGASALEDAEQKKQPEHALADTSDWHWESSSSDQPTSSTQPSSPDSAGPSSHLASAEDFWEWESAEASQPSATTGRQDQTLS